MIGWIIAGLFAAAWTFWVIVLAYRRGVIAGATVMFEVLTEELDKVPPSDEVLAEERRRT